MYIQYEFSGLYTKDLLKPISYVFIGYKKSTYDYNIYKITWVKTCKHIILKLIVNAILVVRAPLHTFPKQCHYSAASPNRSGGLTFRPKRDL